MKNKLQTIGSGLRSFGSKFLTVALMVALTLLAFGSNLMAQSSAYVSQMEDAADQMVVDLGAVLPIALGVAVVSVGVFIVWSIFKRLARG